MNHWARMLNALPATAQRLVARTQRITFPRTCAPAERPRRLRTALCRARTVRATYFALPADAQAALQHLRACPRGLPPAHLTAQYGGLRPWSQLLADPTPQTLTERLVLLGWLLPRPETPRHPLRFLLPPELRRWLPRPLQLADAGPAPAAPPAPALRGVSTLLLAAAEQPLPLRRDGTLRAAALRQLQPRLAPLPPQDATALCQFLIPLLSDLGLLAAHGSGAALAPAGQRFLALSATQQVDRLRQAWERAPRPDAALTPLLLDRRGIDWPCLRRRLLAWAGALPVGRLLDPDRLSDALEAAAGPLADTQTHGLRAVTRRPWQPRRAAVVWDAALRGPLHWLGLISWTDPARAPAAAATDGRAWCFVPPATDAASVPHDLDPLDAAWQYGTDGTIRVPHHAGSSPVLGLLPAAHWIAADAVATTYQITPQTLAVARSSGSSSAVVAAHLTAQAGPLPLSWRVLLDIPSDRVQLITTTVIHADTPAVIDRAARQRSVRRSLGSRPASCSCRPIESPASGVPSPASTSPSRAATIRRSHRPQQGLRPSAPCCGPPARAISGSRMRAHPCQRSPRSRPAWRQLCPRSSAQRTLACPQQPPPPRHRLHLLAQHYAPAMEQRTRCTDPTARPRSATPSLCLELSRRCMTRPRCSRRSSRRSGSGVR